MWKNYEKWSGPSLLRGSSCVALQHSHGSEWPHWATSIKTTKNSFWQYPSKAEHSFTKSRKWQTLQDWKIFSFFLEIAGCFKLASSQHLSKPAQRARWMSMCGRSCFHVCGIFIVHAALMDGRRWIGMEGGAALNSLVSGIYERLRTAAAHTMRK